MKLNIERTDLFQFVRFIMYIAAMHPLHLEQYFHKFLRPLGSLLELLYEMFLYFVSTHIAILYICTIYISYKSAKELDLELLVNCLIQTIIYLWTIVMKFYFRRFRSNTLEELISMINLKYKTRSAIGK